MFLRDLSMASGSLERGLLGFTSVFLFSLLGSIGDDYSPAFFRAFSFLSAVSQSRCFSSEASALRLD